jgi:hypothetical protein
MSSSISGRQATSVSSMLSSPFASRHSAAGSISSVNNRGVDWTIPARKLDCQASAPCRLCGGSCSRQNAQQSVALNESSGDSIAGEK